MTGTSGWIEANERYLVAALALVRLRLLRQATRIEAAGRSGAPPADRGEDPTDADLVEAEARVAEAERGDPPPSALILSGRLRLSRFEREVLLLCRTGRSRASRSRSRCSRTRPGTRCLPSGRSATGGSSRSCSRPRSR
jgi:hypothetical protein